MPESLPQLNDIPKNIKTAVDSLPRHIVVTEHHVVAENRQETELGHAESFIEGTYLKKASLDAVAGRLQQIPWLQPEQWASLDLSAKVVALNKAGQVLGQVYEIPAPPLLVQGEDDRYLFGSYGDGYIGNPVTGLTEGADYGIKMNVLAETDCEKLFGDDPRVALATYAHEFRHAYQAEQVNRLRKPEHRGLIDNPVAAQDWSHEYIGPDPDYDAYLAQPVEKDARDFEEALVKWVFDQGQPS